jgi:hypothetical protein
MLAENVFTSNHQLDQRLNDENFTLEMVDVHEWIARDNDTDDLFAIYADRRDADTIQIACSCRDGAKEIACTHGLRVVRRIRADQEILARVLRTYIADTSEAELVS